MTFFFLGFSPYPQSAFIYKCASLALLKSLTVSTGMNVNDIFIQKEMEWKIWVICEGHLSSVVIDLGTVYSNNSRNQYLNYILNSFKKIISSSCFHHRSFFTNRLEWHLPLWLHWHLESVSFSKVFSIPKPFRYLSSHIRVKGLNFNPSWEKKCLLVFRERSKVTVAFVLVDQ